MWQTISDRPRGIRWTLFSTLENVDFADDLTLVSHTHQHMQEKTTRLSMFEQQVGLKISPKKTEVMMLDFPNPLAVKVNREEFPTTEEFTYLGSTVRHDGGPGSDIRNRLNKEQLWNAKHCVEVIPVQHQDQDKTVPELRTFHPTYGSECWRMTESDLNKLSTFHTKNTGRSCEHSGPRPSPTLIFFRCNHTARAPSSCESNRDGSDI